MVIILCKQAPHNFSSITTIQLGLSTKIEDHSIQFIPFEQSQVPLLALFFTVYCGRGIPVNYDTAINLKE